jgi:hypothetical protein
MGLLTIGDVADVAVRLPASGADPVHDRLQRLSSHVALHQNCKRLQEEVVCSEPNYYL